MNKLLYSIASLLFVFNCAVYGQEPKITSVPENEISVSTSNLGFDNLSLKYSTRISDVTWFKNQWI